jgi:phosphatidate cytidylyltransferase
MTLNKQTFRTRTATAVLFVLLMLTGLLWNQWSFFILFAIIHIGCWLEYQRLVGMIDPGYKEITDFHKWGVILAGCCVLLYFTDDSFRLFNFRLNELGWWLGLIFLFLLPLLELLFEDNIRAKNIGHSAFGLLYISLSWGLMIDLYHIQLIPLGRFFSLPFFPLLIIISLWINDTMAYIAGSLFGKTPLTAISPKKTWEGTVIGILLSVGITGTVARYAFSLPFEIATIHLYIIPAIAAIIGTIGDILESRIKRLASVKDSGHIMPGHGGFLDRFDSLLLAVPFAWLYIWVFLR